MVADRLRALREERGYTQQQLADRAGISDATVLRIESGESSPRRVTLERLAEALETSVRDLAGEEFRAADIASITESLPHCDADDVALIADLARRLSRNGNGV